MVLLTACAVLAVMLLQTVVLCLFGKEGLLRCLPLIAVVVIAAAAVTAKIVSRSIIRPLSKIDLHSDDIDGDYEEIEPFLARISHQNAEISRQLGELERKQQELELMTEHMAEGFLLLDSTGGIMTYNRSAARFIADIRDFSGHPLFGRLTESALAGKHCEDILRHENQVFQLIANPVTAEEKGKSDAVIGAVILILDVTEREMRDELRREFTSNVSHELKTPLTTIYGISDMLDAGIVKPEDSGTFIRSIRTEASRMISLIDDIIKLSRLDESGSQLQREDVDLTELSASVIERLRIAADEKNVTFRLFGEHVVYCGVRSVLDEMIFNLCDNAVKYNKEGGSVSVSVYRNGGHACISVEDTGIGIPKKDQGRVFERFFRVDKSHSRRIGGTGLGLSIVRHAVMYHDGTISLISEEGEGTKITVTL